MWPDSGETQELLIAARSGDRAATEALLARHRDALRRLVALRLDRAIQRRVDASDIVQDALVEANRRLDEYLKRPGLPFHLWLRQIARDRMLDAHRRHHVAARRSVDREQALAAPSHAGQSAFDLAAQLNDPRELTPAAALVRQELQERFRGILSQLEENDREIIEMRHFEQLSNQEAAAALGLSEPAAGMRYVRALRRLRALLDVAPSEHATR
ncbi:MAG TPA: sigma-70 family RNA polymerase sigma factor [Pirellulales bacterium]|nr:sigma-70 family RNA polymerase sigma factor [Pirellulales bacterium]